jgi:hypothetical protein
MSRPWIRKQRMSRRAGLPHVLGIDPIMIGSRPRYRLADVEAWLDQQGRPTTAEKPMRQPSELAPGGGE